MKSDAGTKKYSFAAIVLTLALSAVVLAAQSEGGRPNVAIWDTMAPAGDAAKIENRRAWQAVPTDLITLEDDPFTAASDPAYYGREYAFQGDAAVENEQMVVVFMSETGRAIIFSKADSQKKAELVPVGLKGKPVKITQCSIVHNTGDQADLEVAFSDGGAANQTLVFSFGKSGVVGIRPAGDMKGISLISQIEYGVVPDFVADDLVFGPETYLSRDKLYVPCEHLFVGLIRGGNDMLVVTKPEGGNGVTLVAGADGGKRIIQSVDFESNGKSVYLALLSAPGIWHEEELKPTYLEKDVTSNWKRPFKAKWTTQLLEAKVKTTYTFRESRQNIWRGAFGSFIYPVRFEGDAAVYRLGKKILPKGKSVVYFLEGNGAAIPVATPVDVMKATLGMDACDEILDVAGRRLRTHHRRGAVGVRRACTCGCTAAIEAVFKDGREVEKRQYVEAAVDDMVYFVRRHMARLDEYQDFARSMLEFIEKAGRSDGQLKVYLDGTAEIVQEIPEDYARAKENMKTLKYADELARQTKALTHRENPGTLKACLELCKQWRSMGGAQDDVLAQAHRITRKIFQEAGYQCVDSPKAVEVAGRIRQMCRKCLRNPDGYEIWANY